MVADACVVPGSGIFEGERAVAGKDFGELGEARLAVLVFLSAMPQLRLHR
jgi:hypothetical protein